MEIDHVQTRLVQGLEGTADRGPIGGQGVDLVDVVPVVVDNVSVRPSVLVGGFQFVEADEGIHQTVALVLRQGVVAVHLEGAVQIQYLVVLPPQFHRKETFEIVGGKQRYELILGGAVGNRWFYLPVDTGDVGTNLPVAEFDLQGIRIGEIEGDLPQGVATHHPREHIGIREGETTDTVQGGGAVLSDGEIGVETLGGVVGVLGGLSCHHGGIGLEQQKFLCVLFGDKGFESDIDVDVLDTPQMETGENGPTDLVERNVKPVDVVG